MFKRICSLTVALACTLLVGCGDSNTKKDPKNNDGDTGQYSLSVSDQKAADSETVTVESVETGSEPTWLVIHEQNEAGDGPGDIIGPPALLEAETESSDIDFELNRQLTRGETLYAMLHYDDPADSEFSFGDGDGQDLPVKVDGEVVVSSFEIQNDSETPDTGSYSISVSNQDLPISDADSLTIDSVKTGDKPAWIVIHEQNSAGDSFGSVIGHSSLINADSEQSDVNVSLNRDVGNETLYAMLHYDDPADGNYTFGQTDGEDTPISKNGDIIVKSFRVMVEGDDTAEPTNYELNASDQELPNAARVQIDSVTTVDKPAWIVIHEQNDAGDSFGDVIGHSSVIPANSQRSDLTVPLDRAAEEGETLYAMLHYDDPSDGKYTFGQTDGEDTPIKKDGSVVVKPFEVTLNISDASKYSISVSDQMLNAANDPMQVNVDAITVGAKDVWVVIRRTGESQDTVGEVLGHTDSVISADTNTENITVPLETSLDPNDDKLFAVFHYENPDDGKFTFTPTNGADTAVRTNGTIVKQSFQANLASPN